MKKIYDHEKLCQHKKMAIPQNIRLGEMMSELLNEVSPKLLSKVIILLKKQYMEEHDEILNTKEKKDHVQMTLDSIGKGKFNFAKQNIEEGQKFNSFYPEVQIPLPTQERNFQCAYCKERYFKTNASLYSHYRSCPKKNYDMEHEDEVKRETNEGFRPVRRKQFKLAEQKAKKVKVDILQHEVEEEKKERVKEEKEAEVRMQRDMPISTFSFGSDIFYGDD